MKKVLRTTELVNDFDKLFEQYYRDQYSGTSKYYRNAYNSWKLESILLYSKLMPRAPELGMFVPCDTGGNYYQEPAKTIQGTAPYMSSMEIYREAKDRVWFEECDLKRKAGTVYIYMPSTQKKHSIKDNKIYVDGKWLSTIEEIATDIELTPTDAFMAEFIKEEVLV